MTSQNLINDVASNTLSLIEDSYATLIVINIESGDPEALRHTSDDIEQLNDIQNTYEYTSDDYNILVNEEEAGHTELNIKLRKFIISLAWALSKVDKKYDELYHQVREQEMENIESFQDYDSIRNTFDANKLFDNINYFEQFRRIDAHDLPYKYDVKTAYWEPEAHQQEKDR